MGLYLEYSNRVMEVYKKYAAPEDIHRYSVDEVFIDLTDYLWLYKESAHDITMRIIRDVQQTTGITATAGIGENLYLAKVAMDIVAKHIPADANGVRIAELTEKSYREQLWNHHPLTDFWRVGRRTAEKLAKFGVHTMGQLARFSLSSENLLFKLFGVNAELLIDHAWGWEPCTIMDIKKYHPKSSSISSGQVLNYPYSTDNAGIVVQEMAETLALDLLSKKLLTRQVILTIGYDQESLSNHEIQYNGKVTTDFYGRKIPEHAHGSKNLSHPTCSAQEIINATLKLYHEIIDNNLLVRRINITAAHLSEEGNSCSNIHGQAMQLDLFNDLPETLSHETLPSEQDEKEQRLMQASLEIRKKYGKNMLLKGINFDKVATSRERNGQLGGHKK